MVVSDGLNANAVNEQLRGVLPALRRALVNGGHRVGETVTNVEQFMVVRGEKGDEWNLYWDNTTKFKHDVDPSELRQGDHVHFDFVEKNGKMWLTELRRTKKAERD